MRPFTVFKWKAGSKGRFKKTEICQTCAKLKNVCQTCLFDLQYGLPVEVRDKFLGEAKVNIPECEGNRDYWSQLATENMDTLVLPYQQKTNAILDTISRTGISTTADRNKPHVCTFFLKNECKMGDLCTFRHELGPSESFSNTPSSIRDRFYGVNDPIAKRILSTISDYKFVQPPQDVSISTICVYYTDVNMGDDISNIFRQYGAVEDESIASNHTFITYTTRRCAEEAIKYTYNNLVVQGKHLHVVWCSKRDSGKGETEEGESGEEVHQKEAEAGEISVLVRGEVYLPFYRLADPAKADRLAMPPLPALPPLTDSNINASEVSFLNVGKEKNGQAGREFGGEYASVNTAYYGGLKPNKQNKVNLVNY